MNAVTTEAKKTSNSDSAETDDDDDDSEKESLGDQVRVEETENTSF